MSRRFIAPALLVLAAALLLAGCPKDGGGGLYGKGAQPAQERRAA